MTAPSRALALKKGDRIRLKVRLFFGTKGYATVIRDFNGDRGDVVHFCPDGENPDTANAIALRCEVAKCRDQMNRSRINSEAL